MPFTGIDIEMIQSRLTPVVGKKAWGVTLGVGSFITLEFGEARPASGGRGRSHGEWHLWVYCCAWRLEQGDTVLAGSEDPRPKLQEAVTRLEGLGLHSVEILSPGGETVLTFEQDVVLRLFPIFSEGFEHWMLYAPDGNVLTIGPGTDWSWASAAQVPS